MCLGPLLSKIKGSCFLCSHSARLLITSWYELTYRILAADYGGVVCELYSVTISVRDCGHGLQCEQELYEQTALWGFGRGVITSPNSPVSSCRVLGLSNSFFFLLGWGGVGWGGGGLEWEWEWRWHRVQTGQDVALNLLNFFFFFKDFKKIWMSQHSSVWFTTKPVCNQD